MPASNALNILLVDDTMPNHVAVTAALEGLPCGVICVDTGKKALRRLLDEEFAVILLDVNMPDMDGFEVAELIRKVDRLRQIPILFLSAVRQEECEVYKGYSMGAIDYLFTPFNPQLLRAKVNSLLQLHTLNLAVRQQADELTAINARLVLEIRERQLAEEAVRAANEKLALSNSQIEQVSRAKSQFLSTMSHELRTPLNAIIGFSEFLLCGKSDPPTRTQSEHLTTILQSAEHLLSLINDVLDLSKVEAGKIQVAPKLFAIRKVLDDVNKLVKAVAIKRHVHIDWKIAPEIVDVTLDPRLFKQILFNLLSNAIKFNRESGRVLVTVSLGSDPERFRLTVEDTGIGIRSEDLPRLFQEFERLGPSPNKYQEGTGLGLALCRRLIELHAGQISVHSEFGKGTSFLIELPRTIAPSTLLKDELVPA